MCGEPSLEESKKNFDVLELGEPTAARLHELMQGRGVSPNMLEALVEEGVLDVFAGICLASCEDILFDLRQERFAEALGEDVAERSAFDGAPRSALLPVFAGIKGEASEQLSDMAREIGKIMAVFEFEAVQQMEELGASEKERAGQMDAIICSVLDFLPRPFHGRIMSAREMFLLRAQSEGFAAFDDESEFEGDLASSPAKSL